MADISFDEKAAALKSSALPFTREEILSAVARKPTPFHIYHENTIKDVYGRMKKAFSWVDCYADDDSNNNNRNKNDSNGDGKGFQNFFAVKATPNPNILKILADMGSGFDCSSYAELSLCGQLGLKGDAIMFSSNNTPLQSYRLAKDMGVHINVDDISHIDYIHENIGLPKKLSFRYNPGTSREGNVIIGKPEESKFGLTREQIFEAYNIARDKGVEEFGLHTMVVSNCLDIEELESTAIMMFKLAKEIHERLGIRLKFVNLGGGIGIPYRPGETPVDFEDLSKAIKKQYDLIIRPIKSLHPIRVVYENGRCITGPSGVLVTTVIHQKNTYRNYIGVDGGIQNLMRPALYGAYHHITTISTSNQSPTHEKLGMHPVTGVTNTQRMLPNKRCLLDYRKEMLYDVVGGLCENNDKLAIQRNLGPVKIGDIICIHDTGAHGHAMGNNYNGVTRSAEYLLRGCGDIVCIRRAEVIPDLFRCIEWALCKPKFCFYFNNNNYSSDSGSESKNSSFLTKCRNVCGFYGAGNEYSCRGDKVCAWSCMSAVAFGVLAAVLIFGNSKRNKC